MEGETPVEPGIRIVFGTESSHFGRSPAPQVRGGTKLAPRLSGVEQSPYAPSGPFGKGDTGILPVIDSPIRAGQYRRDACATLISTHTLVLQQSPGSTP